MPTISGSVGQGGKNLQADVTTVQELLNQARGKDGLPPIKVDGFVGPETVGAIRAFQQSRFGWADGRVDPNGPTMAALNALTSELRSDQIACSAEDLSGGISGFPSFTSRKSLVESSSSSSSSSSPPIASSPKATALLHKAETATWLSAAGNAVALVAGLLDPAVVTKDSIAALELLMEWQALKTHFHIDQEPNQLKMLSTLGKLYTHMKIAVNTGDTCFESDLETDAFAITDAGGFARRNDKTNPGRMYFGLKYLFVGKLTRVVTIIHEAAHYVDKNIDHFASAVPAPNGRALTGSQGQAHTHNYAQLTPSEAMNNAASYAGFAIHMAKRMDMRPTITQ